VQPPVEAHLRNFRSPGFEDVTVRDATAGAGYGEDDGGQVYRVH
jgi:hypothetical protein